MGLELQASFIVLKDFLKIVQEFCILIIHVWAARYIQILWSDLIESDGTGAVVGIDWSTFS